MGFRICLFHGKHRRERVQLADTLGLLYHLNPGFDSFFGSRVTVLIDDIHRPSRRKG